MYTYTAYTLIIQSELELPELVPAEGAPDVVIRFGKLNVPGYKSSNGGDYFLGAVEGVATFLVQKGCEIVVEPEPQVEEAVLRPIIEGPLLSTLLRQRKKLVLHAGSFVAHGMSFGFMADSGWGKSTLINTFHTAGYTILTDDVMSLNLEAEQVTVVPGIPQVKLCFDAAEFMGYKPGQLPLLHSHAPKVGHRLASGFSAREFPLKRLYVLDYGDRHDIIPLSPQEAFVALVHHSRAMTLLTSEEFRVRHLHQCSALLQHVSVCRLIRKRSLEELPAVVKLIESDIAQLTRQPSQHSEPMLHAAH
ncbi:hypothetical protein ACQ4M4_19390 [Leptolyngbya sp. AN02str]|uniref:hypothetical protein n=1 Tax=Leptolyngbya sp. AN02str TaxID=3423363 RepID=UPI003D3151FD